MSRTRSLRQRLIPIMAIIMMVFGIPALSLGTATPAAATDSNQFAWPASGHTDANEVAWHMSNENGAMAVDIQASVGTGVYAAQSGVVVTASTSCANSGSWGCGHGFGNYVVVRHDRSGVSNPLYTLYAHLNKDNMSVSVNQSVSLGTQLGVIALSGSTTGGHTHFAIGTCATPWTSGNTNCTVWNGADTSSTNVTHGNAVQGIYSQLDSTSAVSGSNADILAVVRNDAGSGHTAAHVVNGANWGQYLLNSATGLPVTDSNWDFDWADFNHDGVLDLWAFNRAPGYGHTVVHVINGDNWGEWLQAGDIALPATDSNWSFAVGNRS